MSRNTGQFLLFPRTANQDLYPLYLSTVLSEGLRIYDPSYAMARDAYSWEKTQIDPMISGAIERRKLGTIGRTWSYEPATDDEMDVHAAAVFQDLIRKTPRFKESLFNLCDAIFRGKAYADITGRFRFERVHERVRRRWWIPGRLTDIDKRRFRPVTEDDDVSGDYKFKWLRHSPRRKKWEEVTRPELLVVHAYHDTESQLSQGRGLLDCLFIIQYIRGQIIKDGMQGLKRWASGLVLASMDALADDDPDNDNATRAKDLATTILNMIEDNVVVVDDREKVEVVTGGMEGHQMIHDWLDRLEKETILRIEGAYLPTGGDGDGGAYNLGVEQGRRTDGFREYDRDSLCESMQTFNDFTWRMNRATLDEHTPGLGEANVPRLSLAQEVVEDPDAVVKNATELLKAKVPLKKRQVYERTGWEMPTEEDFATDEVFEDAGQLEEAAASFGHPFGGVPGEVDPAGNGNRTRDG